ncbi:MAG TPA: glycogen synthase [Steroidobacteraceae bacterium]|nr:glycogen synthase [Steroidobacteraceae bacterium]
MPAPLGICFVASEVAPLAKTGGLADVSSALPRFLHSQGHDVRLFLPFYSSIETAKLELAPLDGLKDVPLQLGTRRFTFSIITARLAGSSLPIHLVHCPALYQRPGIYTAGPDEHLRFLLLTRAAIESCQRLGFSPQVFHCNDWHTAFAPLFLRSIYGWDKLFAKTRTVLTIHNIGYQGVFGAAAVGDLGLGEAQHLLHQDDLRAGRINSLRHGVMYADVISTVSPTYAREICTDQYGMGLQSDLRARGTAVLGILNGVDYTEWNPTSDPHLPHHYNAEDLAGKTRMKQFLMRTLKLELGRRVPLVGMVTRMTVQKGIDLLFDSLPRLLASRNFRLAVLGSGEARYEEFFTSLQRAHPGKVVFHRGYSEKLAHLIEAASDIFLMPSLYEPCGLNQMYSLKYGTVPIVRRTGGLADSVQLYDPDTGAGDGIVFNDYNPGAIVWAINAALDLYQNRAVWTRIMTNGMAQDFSWEKQGAAYVELYARLVGA